MTRTSTQELVRIKTFWQWFSRGLSLSRKPSAVKMLLRWRWQLSRPSQGLQNLYFFTWQVQIKGRHGCAWENTPFNSSLHQAFILLSLLWRSYLRLPVSSLQFSISFIYCYKNFSISINLVILPHSFTTDSMVYWINSQVLDISLKEHHSVAWIYLPRHISSHLCDPQIYKSIILWSSVAL